MDAPVRLRIQPGKWRWSRAAKERAVHVRPTTKIGVQGETCWSSLGFSKLGVQISWLISTFPMKWWKNRVSTISGHAHTFANDSSKQNIWGWVLARSFKTICQIVFQWCFWTTTSPIEKYRRSGFQWCLLTDVEQFADNLAEKHYLGTLMHPGMRARLWWHNLSQQRGTINRAPQKLISDLDQLLWLK